MGGNRSDALLVRRWGRGRRCWWLNRLRKVGSCVQQQLLAESIALGSRHALGVGTLVAGCSHGYKKAV